MPKIKAPGVYTREVGIRPPSIAAVPTALPVFIGHTEFARDGDVSLSGVAHRVSSMADFERYFGAAPRLKFKIVPANSGSGPAPLSDAGARLPPDLPSALLKVPGATPREYDLRLTRHAYTLHAALRHFYQNGGDAAYVVSIGSYDDPIKAGPMRSALRMLRGVDEPTLVVIPEITRLSRIKAAKVNRSVLAHCAKMQDRFALLDMPGGHLAQQGPHGDPIRAFRTDIGASALAFGAAYYPWLKTALFTASDFTFDNLKSNSREVLSAILKQESPKIEGDLLDQLAGPLSPEIDARLRSTSLVYSDMTQAFADCANTLPPAAAIAGLYAQTDRAQGVWKAPAGIAVNGTIAPAQALSDTEQQALSSDPSGVSINPISAVTGRGIRVWGARTLHGASSEWRYVPVRRTAIMIEESINKALGSFVFQPNTTESWEIIRSIIETFLGTLWRRGAMQGAKASDAYFVRVGLGETMTQAHIDQGIVNVTLGFAPLKPAEFVILKFQHKTSSP